MFNDVRLPETDAWAAMTRDLRQCKESRNALSKENSYVSLLGSVVPDHCDKLTPTPSIANSSGGWQNSNPSEKSKSYFCLTPPPPSSSAPRRCNPRVLKLVPDRWSALLRRHGLIS